MAATKDGKDDFRKLTGVQKSAIFLMALGEETVTKLFSMMEEDEIREISSIMSSLGQVNSEVVERLLMEFAEQVSASGALVGNYDSTERLLTKALGKGRVDAIMEEIRGPAGRTTWDKLGNVSEEVLANFLKNEYPQTVAVVLSKIKPDHAARVLMNLPEDLSMEVMMRMISMESIKKDVMDGIEKTLRMEFMSNLAKRQTRDSHEIIAEIFNNFDRNAEAKFMGKLEERSKEAAERVRALMFTFEDLQKIDKNGIQTLLRGIDKDKLGIALKGASDPLKQLFLGNMSERAAKILKEDMEAMGPVRIKDVDEAQQYIVSQAKDLAAKGEIIIAGDSEEEQLIY
ncbi:MAG: flagellar motor switch protein FliG [Pseudomonadota bacterium]|nr:flagellar motor switch protein FliG [Pseudomonadota bacterium]MDE3036877.1 flagellar motor switch protein FliG [Pseudomonadota bacterium]